MQLLISHLLTPTFFLLPLLCILTVTHLPQPSPFPNQNNNNPFHRQHHIPSSTNRPLSSPPCYHTASSYPPTVTITFIFDPNYPVPLAIRHRQNTDSASDSRQTAPTTPMTNLLAASLRLAVNV
ncbi:unnamed protein product [Vicia faba]|uniref:Uncharacterized protein n=1 Tax=Vicia faba TaxID=3906 RepID=A0AAV0YW40_VICFA|nr:unnamed protein product [Vicia faba]